MSARNIQVVDRNNGVKKEGELEEIVDFSRRLECILEEVCDDEEPVENFDFWRPEDGDDVEDIKDRTAAAASISKREVEIESEGFKEDFSDAKEEFKREINKLYGEEGIKDSDYSEEGLISPVKKVFKPFASVSLKLVRETEELIYSFMLNFNPYYFDAEKFSISLKKNGDQFEINFKSPEEEYRRTVKQRFDSEE